MKIGDRCRLNATGLQRNPQDSKMGVIVGQERRRYTSGVREETPSIWRIRWDGSTRVEGWNKAFVEPEPPQADEIACFECGDGRVIQGVCTSCGAGKT